MPPVPPPVVITTDPGNNGVLFWDADPGKYYVKITVDAESKVNADLTPMGQSTIHSDQNGSTVPANTQTNYYFTGAPSGSNCQLNVAATPTSPSHAPSVKILTVNTPSKSKP